MRAEFLIVLAVSAAFIIAGATISLVSRQLGRSETMMEAAEGRVKHMKDAQERRDEIEALPDDGLADRIGRWMR